MSTRLCAFALALSRALVLAQNSATDGGVRDAPLPCAEARKDAKSYLESRGIRMEDAPRVFRDLPRHLLFRSGAPLLDGAGQAIRLSRFGVRKYITSSLAPLRIYAGFDVAGQITFTETKGGCRLHLSLVFAANELSPWLIFAEGRRAILGSNGKLEDEYLQGIVAT